MTVREILRDIVGSGRAADTGSVAGISFLATVESVDAAQYSCTVKIVGSDGILENVRLKAEFQKNYGLAAIPKKGSFVVVTALTAAGYFVSLCSEVETIELKIDSTGLIIDKDGFVFNGGDNAGVVKIDELKKNLESLKTFVEKMNNALPAAFTAIGAGPTASGAAGTSSYSGAMSGAVISFGDMENKKVKH